MPSASGEGRPAEQGASDTREEEKKTDDDQLHQKKTYTQRHQRAPAPAKREQKKIDHNKIIKKK